MYTIDCRNINSYFDFIDAFNRGMIDSVGGKWNGNLDAFNDYLAWPEKVPYQLVILGADRCEQKLNYLANDRDESSLWEILQEILLSHPNWVTVKFE